MAGQPLAEIKIYKLQIKINLRKLYAINKI